MLQLLPRKEAYAKAAEAVEAALKLDGRLAEARASKGLLLIDLGKYPEAQDELKQAVTLNPSYASAHHWHAICIANLGKLDETIGEAKLAWQSDPLSGPSRNILGVMYIYSRDFDKALEVFNEILKAEPNFTQSLNWRSNIYVFRGMYQEAMRDIARASEGGS